MKAFVESGCETSNTKSSSHAESKNLVNNGTLWGLFSFYLPIFFIRL